MPLYSQTLTTASEQSFYYQQTLGGDSRHCTNGGLPFSANPGDTMTGTITASQSVMVVYLLSEQEYTAWEAQGSCDPRQSGIGVQWASGSYSSQVSNAQIDWTAPVSGQYEFVIEIFSGATVTVTINLSQQTSVATTTIAYSTQFSSGTQLITQTFTSAVVQAIPAIPPWISSLAIVIILAVIVAILLFFAKRGIIHVPRLPDFKMPKTERPRKRTRRSKPKVEAVAPDTKSQVTETPEPKEAKPAPPAKTTMYCPQCGAVIPRDSKFCKECGTKL